MLNFITKATSGWGAGQLEVGKDHQFLPKAPRESQLDSLCNMNHN
jgi:hypothetical protein